MALDYYQRAWQAYPELRRNLEFSIELTRAKMRQGTGADARHSAQIVKTRRDGVDVVLFWKQDDTGLYGRRHDMIIRYLASRADVRKIVVFDAPIAERKLIAQREDAEQTSHNRLICENTYKKTERTR